MITFDLYPCEVARGAIRLTRPGIGAAFCFDCRPHAEVNAEPAAWLVVTVHSLELDTCDGCGRPFDACPPHVENRRIEVEHFPGIRIY